MANIIDLATEDNLQYNFFPVSSGSVQFKIRAPNDAFIALTKGPQWTEHMIEVVIGSDRNKKTVIRKNRAKPDKAEIKTTEILNGGEFRGFWVRWDVGIISAGHEGESIPFISWSDPQPFPINFVGVCTANGATGTWKIEDGAEFDTPDKLEYTFVPVAAGFLAFEFQGPHNCHVALTSAPSEVDPMYEIIIGAWGNTQSFIRYCRQKPDKVVVQTPGIVDPKTFRRFVIEWKCGRIFVREGMSDAVLMEWVDPTPFHVTHFGVRTVGGSRGNWRINHFSSNVTQLHLTTEDILEYNFFPVPSGSVQFKIRAPNDAFIALTKGPQEARPIVEVVIGCYHNTKTVIRKNRAQPDKAEIKTNEILNGGEFRGFWVRWDVGIISAGRDGESIPFISWSDPKPFPINFVGVCTGWGATGSWKIEDRAEFDTPDKLEYTFVPVAAGSLAFEFCGPHNCNVALTSAPSEVDPMYEIIIGAWGNTQSFIRYCRQKPDKVVERTPGIVDPNTFRRFVIEWKCGRIFVREGRSGAVLMEWVDPAPFNVTHFGVRTAWGSRGNWRIDHFSTAPVPTVSTP